MVDFKDRFFGDICPTKGLVIEHDGIKYKIIELTSIQSNNTGWWASGKAVKVRK